MYNAAANLQQYEPPIYPQDWQTSGKKFYARLIEVLDDIYRRYGRLDFSDLAPTVNEWKVTTDSNVSNLTGGLNTLEDDFGLLRQDVDGNTATLMVQAGQITQITQDVAGNLSLIQQNANSINQIVLDVAGNQSQILQQAGQIAQIVQDVAGNSSAILQQAGLITQIVADIEGNTSAINQQATQITQMVSDIAGNASVIAQQAGQITQMVSDIQGNTSAISQQAGQITQIVSDVAGNASMISQQAGQISQIITNASGMQTQITQNAAAIATKASATSVDALTGRVTSAETTIVQQANLIATKANATTVDALAGRVTSAETSITQMANQIVLKANQSTVDTLSNTVTTAGSLLKILQTMIGAQVYEATYNGVAVGQGTAFPSNPTANMGFIRTDYNPPRFYVREGNVWVERSAQTLKTSGISIEPNSVSINTPNLNLALTNPNNAAQSLVSLTPSGMVFKDTNGNTVLNFNTATGSLTISGTIMAAAGLIGGFQIGNSTLSNGNNISLDSSGTIRIGSTANPFFTVNNSQTYIGNPLVIKPGVLPVTNLRPNLYYNESTGVLYRTTWAGSVTALSLVVSLSGSGGSQQVAPSSNATISWTISGGASPYTMSYEIRKNGTVIATRALSAANATGSATFNVGSGTGTVVASMTAHDSDGNNITLNSGTLTVQAIATIALTIAQVTPSGSTPYAVRVTLPSSYPEILNDSYSIVYYVMSPSVSAWTVYTPSGIGVGGRNFTIQVPYSAFGGSTTGSIYAVVTQTATGATGTTEVLSLGNTLTATLAVTGSTSTTRTLTVTVTPSGSYSYAWEFSDDGSWWVGSTDDSLGQTGTVEYPAFFNRIRVTVMNRTTGTRVTTNVVII